MNMTKLFYTTLLGLSWCIAPIVAEENVDVGDYSGSRSYSAGQVTATGGWATSDFTVSWDIENVGGSHPYHYTYTFSGSDGDLSKAISHAILQVSDVANASDFTFTSTDTVEGPITFGDMGNSNPGIPGDIYGVKLDDLSDGTVVFDFYSTKDPIWGDFYAKDGVDNNQGEKTDVYAYNTGFGVDPTGASSFDNWIPRPDSGMAVPEPTTLLLLGSAMGAAALKRRKKKS